MIFQRPFEKLLEKSVRVHWHLSLSVTILKKSRDLKPIPDFADEVNDIIWQLEDLFFGKKKRHVNPGMTEAGQNKLTMMAKSNRILPS
jgi:hypothetical protein